MFHTKYNLCLFSADGYNLIMVILKVFQISDHYGLNSSLSAHLHSRRLVFDMCKSHTAKISIIKHGINVDSDAIDPTLKELNRIIYQY